MVEMNGDYIQNQRYKLQKRVRRLNSTKSELFDVNLKQFWGYIENNTFFVDILEELGNRYPDMEAEADKIMKRQRITSDDEVKHIAISYFLIKKIVNSDAQRKAVDIGFVYGSERKFEAGLNYFRDIFLEPLYEYLDEQLDDQRAILALLRRYKHKCEWFQRENLYLLWEKEPRRGEKNLALHLYEYLHDQGLDFTIEPSSISGEADLVASQNSDDPLIADTKIFNPDKSKGKSYIAKGFNQVYLYTTDYNESFGYLIIYKTSENDLRFALTNQNQSTPFVTHNNKTIFIITIDIFPHKTTASQRGQLKPVEITENDLISIE